MRLLVDTVTFLWFTLDDARLSERARGLVRDADNEVFLSVVSAWEIALKYGQGRLKLPVAAGEFVSRYRELHGIRSLALDEEAALYVARLPLIHKDPFDRMLMCQAIVEGLGVVTPDAGIAKYPVRVIW